MRGHCTSRCVLSLCTSTHTNGTCIGCACVCVHVCACVCVHVCVCMHVCV